MSIKKVLIPTDFSKLSNQAIDVGLPMVQQFGAEVVFLHVTERLDHPDEMTALFDDGYAFLMDRAHALLNDLIVRAEKIGIKGEPEIQNGTPYLEILRVADKIDADLIIMGTHGRKGFDHMMLGSQAERVVRLATCPVTTIKVKKAEV